MPVSREEFAGKIKSKYPEYQDIEDEKLVDRVLAKYPQYKSEIETKDISSLGASRGITAIPKEIASRGDQSAIGSLAQRAAQIAELPVKGYKEIIGTTEKIAKAIPGKSKIAGQIADIVGMDSAIKNIGIGLAGRPDFRENTESIAAELIGNAPALVAVTSILPPINVLGPGLVWRSAMMATHGGYGNLALNALHQMAEKGEIEPSEALESIEAGAKAGALIEATVGTLGLSTGILQKFRKGYESEAQRFARARNVTPEVIKNDEIAFTQDLEKAQKTDLITAEHLAANPNIDPKTIIDLKVASGIPESIAQQSVTQAQDTARFISNMRELAAIKAFQAEQLAKQQQEVQKIVQKAEGEVLKQEIKKEIQEAIEPEIALQAKFEPVSEVTQPPDAKFIGFQQDVKGYPPIPLFNVIKPGHPLEKSTVSRETLEKEGLKVPEYPQPKPEILTFDEFSIKRGVSSTPPSFPEYHKAAGGVSKISKKKTQEILTESLAGWQNQRDLLKTEYDRLIQEGLVMPPSRIESLEKLAKGSGPSSQAAQRLLAKAKIPLIGGIKPSIAYDFSRIAPEIVQRGVAFSSKKATQFQSLGLLNEKGGLTQKGEEVLVEINKVDAALKEGFVAETDLVEIPRTSFNAILKNNSSGMGLNKILDEGWATDGVILFKITPKESQFSKAYAEQARKFPRVPVEAVLKGIQNAKDQVVRVLGITKPGKIPIYLLETKNKQRLLIDASQFDFLKSRYPKASIVVKDPTSPIFFVEGKTVQAVQMLVKPFEKEKEIISLRPEFVGGAAGASKGVFEPGTPRVEAEIPKGVKPEGIPSPEEGIESIEPSMRLGQMDKVKPMEMPELVKLTKELMGKVPKIGGLKTSLGLFKGTIIKLKPDIFKDPEVAAKVLAHEIGHLIDYLPEHTMKRGNLLGRLLTLQKFLKNTFGEKEVTNKALREELLALGEWWRPYDKTKSSQSFLAYRKSSAELYADAISVLLNSPGSLKEKAPIFFKEFFLNLDKKPDVKAEYFAIQDFIAGRETSILEGRESDIRHGFARAEDLSQLKREQRELRDTRMWERLRQEHEDAFHPILRKYHEAVARGEVIPDEENPMFILDEFNHRRINDHHFLNRVDEQVMDPLQKAGMTKDDIGLYLLFNRIITERKDLANPYGHTQATAQAGLKQLLDNIGPEKTQILKNVIDKFQDLVFERVQKAVEVGAYNKELFEKTIVPNKGNYATFAVTDYFVEQGFVTAKVKAQKGTLEEVMNPFTATVLKTLALNKLIATQKAKNASRDLLKDFFPDEIKEALRLNPGDKFAIWKNKADRGVLEILEDGKQAAYYVDPFIAESFKYSSPGHLSVIANILNAINRGIFHPLYITFSPGFQAFNLQRDFRRTYKTVPNATVRSLLTEMYKAIGPGIRRQLGIKDDLIEKMLADRALDLPAVDILMGDDPDEFQSILVKHGLLQNPNTRLEKLKSLPILKPLARMLEFIRFTGNVIESLPKIAGYNLRVQAGEKGKALGYNTRNYTGTPNYRIKGTKTEISNAVFMFSNIFLQGMKADSLVASNPKTRSGYWWKTTKIDLMPKLFMFLAASGYLGKELKDHYDRMTEYDKTNYISIPLGKKEGGISGWKSIYMRFPHDESGRLVSGIFWKLLQATKGDVSKLQDVLSFGAGQLPNVAPPITLATAWAQYLIGKNPYDSFRGRNLIPDLEFKAGSWPSLKRMVEWTANQTGQFSFSNYDPATRSTFESVFQGTPVLNRLIKISDYGLEEQARGIQEEKDQTRAEAKLERLPYTRQFVRDFNRLKRLKESDSLGDNQRRLYHRYQKFDSLVIKKFTEAINRAADDRKEEKVTSLTQRLEKIVEKWLKGENEN